MANIPCPTKVDASNRCICSDLPLYNMTSELSDGRTWDGYEPVPPIYLPQPGNTNQPEVPVICVSPISQEDADNCAENGTVPDPPPVVIPPVPGDPPYPPDNPPTEPGDENSAIIIPLPPEEESGFWNTESNCIVFCDSDHAVSATATIPAHTFRGASQFEADFMASNACITLARQRLVCLDADSVGGFRKCEGNATPVSVYIQGGILGDTLQVTGLPSGITHAPIYAGSDVVGFTLSGTWTPCGTYSIGVSMIGLADGALHSFTIPVSIMGITGCDTLPAAKMGIPYSGTLTACACDGPCTFSSTIGHGLTISSAGAISGTPTGTPCPDTINFTVRLEDVNGNSCTKDCTISLSGCGCPDWLSASSSSSDAFSDDGGTYSAISAFEASASCIAGESHGSSQGRITVNGLTPATGTCCIRVQVLLLDSVFNNQCFYRLQMSNLRQPAGSCFPTSIDTTDTTVAYDQYFRTSGVNNITWSLSVKAGPQSPGLRLGGYVHVRLVITNIIDNACADGCPP